MKCLLIAETRGAKLLGFINELLGFAARLKAESSVFLVGDENMLSSSAGRL